MSNCIPTWMHSYIVFGNIEQYSLIVHKIQLFNYYNFTDVRPLHFYVRPLHMQLVLWYEG